MDGASRWQRMRFISLPTLTPVIVLLVLFDIGRIFFGDFGMIYAVIGDKAQLYRHHRCDRHLSAAGVAQQFQLRL